MRRTVPIRDSLTRDLVLIILLLSGLILMIMVWATRRAVFSLSASLTTSTVELSEQRLGGFFTPIEQQMRVIVSMGAQGLLPFDDAQALDAVFAPIIAAYPQVSSLMVGDERGREYMLLRSGGVWSSRQTRADEWDGQARWRRWAGDAGGAITASEEPLEYDARTRPWFRAALATPDRDSLGPEIHWTEPYTFFTTKEPGITAALRFLDPEGVMHVVGFDVLLLDISEFTSTLEVSARGQAAVFTTDWRFVGLPRDSKIGSVKLRDDDLLRTTEEVGWELGLDARDTLEAPPTGPIEPRRFRHAGAPWWFVLEPFELGFDRSLWMVVLVPEADLLRGIVQTRIWIVLLALTVLCGAVWRGVVLARRFSLPIEMLVLQSDRFGQGNLDDTTDIESPVREVQKLAEAHEHMRVALLSLLKLESDLLLARKIQQATLPERLPKVPGFEIGAWNEPAEETGGDTYDVFGVMPGDDGGFREALDDSEGAVLLLADATGHGIGPALSAAQIRSMLRMAVRLGATPAQLITHMNEQLHADLPTGRFLTAWVGAIKTNDATIQSYSAGQGPILVFRAARDEFEVLGADVPPMGVLEEIDSDALREIELEPDDLFIVISDGIVEADNLQSELFGRQRLEEVIRANKQASPDALIGHIKDAVAAFEGDKPASDDKTAVVIKRTG